VTDEVRVIKVVVRKSTIEKYEQAAALLRKNAPGFETWTWKDEMQATIDGAADSLTAFDEYGDKGQ
jgi:hypothetical protein